MIVNGKKLPPHIFQKLVERAKEHDRYVSNSKKDVFLFGWDNPHVIDFTDSEKETLRSHGLTWGTERCILPN